MPLPAFPVPAVAVRSGGLLPLVLLAGSLLAAVSAAQPTASRSPEETLERFRAMSDRAEAQIAAEPFVGVTTDGTVEEGLFDIRSTGVDTGPVREAAQAFLESLTPDQRERTMFAVDDVEWRQWMNQHFYQRRGVSFEEMDGRQREAALGLLAAGLSAKGLRLSRDIMRLNHTLGELAGDNFVEFGEWLYHLTVMGEPSADEPWGWQLDGHHLIVNYFVLGDQVVMTPLFVGSEPVTAEAGKFAGTTILQAEQGAGLAFVESLTDDQRSVAIVSDTKDANDNRAEALQDNLVLPYAGLAATGMSGEQREGLLALIRLFVDSLREPHAQVWMEEITAHLDDTHFAWIGPTDADAVFYYRIHSPVVLIEFDHQRPPTCVT